MWWLRERTENKADHPVCESSARSALTWNDSLARGANQKITPISSPIWFRFERTAESRTPKLRSIQCVSRYFRLKPEISEFEAHATSDHKTECAPCRSSAI
jgi:hypothetical protein